jgi:outer membrane protein assembly factor BamB
MKYRILTGMLILMAGLPALAGHLASKLAEKQPGARLWQFSTRTPNDYCRTAPAIGADGTVYVGFQSGYLYALNSDGSEKWKFKAAGGVHTTPVIGTNGDIYFGAYNYGFDALKPDGSLRWHFHAELPQENSCALGADGSIYFSAFRRQEKNQITIPPEFFALRPDGGIKWTVPLDYMERQKPAIALDGTVYIRTDKFRLMALNPDNGQLKWQINEAATDPVIGADGTVYCGSTAQTFKAIRPDGTLRWNIPVRAQVSCPSVIGADGAVYFGTMDGYLYAVKPNGHIKWIFETDGDCGIIDFFGMSEAQIKKYSSPRLHRSIQFSPAINQDGDIIFAGGESWLYAVKPNGRLKWRCDAGGMATAAPVIDEAGTIYLAVQKLSGSESGKLVAIKGTKGLAKSPWPMMGNDPAHQGRRTN